jgi:hypothetical protein
MEFGDFEAKADAGNNVGVESDAVAGAGTGAGTDVSADADACADAASGAGAVTGADTGADAGARDSCPGRYAGNVTPGRSAAASGAVVVSDACTIGVG